MVACSQFFFSNMLSVFLEHLPCACTVGEQDRTPPKSYPIHCRHTLDFVRQALPLAHWASVGRPGAQAKQRGFLWLLPQVLSPAKDHGTDEGLGTRRRTAAAVAHLLNETKGARTPSGNPLVEEFLKAKYSLY